MNAASFKAICQLLWGEPGWDWGMSGAAVFLKVNERNVYYWGAGTKPVPEGVSRDLKAEVKRRLADETDPTPGLMPIRDAIGVRLRVALG